MDKEYITEYSYGLKANLIAPRILVETGLGKIQIVNYLQQQQVGEDNILPENKQNNMPTEC
jgi:hypothetical protein